MKETFLQNIQNNDVEAVRANLNDTSFDNSYLNDVRLPNIIQSNPELAVLLIEKGANIENVQVFE